MITSHRRIALATAAALLAVGASAQRAEAVSVQNEWELILLGSGSSSQDFDAGGFNVTANVNYYFTDQLQLGVQQTIGYNDFGGDSSWNGGTRVAGYYNFNFDEQQRVVPYVGLQIGYLYGDGTSDTWAAGPQAGLKWFVNDTTFIYGNVTYEFFFNDADDADDAIDDGQFVYGLGIGFTFGGPQ